jgi:hypothetical protein
MANLAAILTLSKSTSSRAVRTCHSDHLRVARYGQIGANVDNAIALGDNDAIWTK